MLQLIASLRQLKKYNLLKLDQSTLTGGISLKCVLQDFLQKGVSSNLEFHHFLNFQRGRN